jgi:hypothetical protein
MNRLDLATLSTADLSLIQRGLAATGFYDGTFLGKGGPKTTAAYERYHASLVPVTSPPPGTPNSLAEGLVASLRTKNGVREIPRNSNRGPDVEEFQRATWLEGTGWAWCAAFVCWGMRELEKQIDYPFERPRTAGAWDFENWARQQGLKLFKPVGTIKKGDIVIFTFSHIGVAIADEQDGYVQTIEGNTDGGGSREGNGVYEKRRAKSQIRSHIRLELKTAA